MKLEEINALRGMTYDELIRTARSLEIAELAEETWQRWTRDRLRLAIIDAIIDRELANPERQAEEDTDAARRMMDI